MNRRLSELLLCVVAALGVGLTAPASAQVATGTTQSAAAGDEDLSEIVVTARRVEERAQDVPISMTVFNQQQLTDRNIVTAGDLAAYTPSVSVDNGFGDEVTSFSIRGFVQSLNTTPSVAVYFADAVVPRGGAVGEPAGSGVAPGSFFDLQNLEVLKGPQGTLFGRNTDGGAVLLVPKKPTSDFEGYVEGSYGSYALGAVQGVLNVPLSDSVRVRLSVNHETRNGFMENYSGIGPRDFNNIDFTAARLSVVVDVTPDIENYLIGSYNLSINNGPEPQLFACNAAQALGGIFCPPQLAQMQATGRPYVTENDFPAPESYLRQVQVIDTTTWRASDHFTVKNIANYGQLLTGLNSSLFGINFIFPGSLGPALGLPPTYPSVPLIATESNPSAAGALTTAQYSFSDELQLQGSALGNKLTWQGGGYVERSGPLGQLTGSQSANFLYCSSVASFQCGGFGLIDGQFATAHYSDLAIFGQATYAILDQLKVTAGARYTNDSTTATIHQTNYAGFPLTSIGPATSVTCAVTLPGVTVATGCTQYFTQNSNAPTYLIDLDYIPLENTLIYAKYSRGYRQGSVATFVAEDFHLYRPEHVNAYEIGEKTTFHGPIPGILNLAAFYNDFTDQQLLLGFSGPPGVTPTSGVANVGNSHIYGAELEASITPFKPLTVGASYTYLVTKLVSATALPPPSGGYTTITLPATVGGPLPYSPKNKLSANATYRLPVPDTWGNMSLGAIFTYTSGTLVSTAAQLATLEPYGLLNMNLTWNSIAGSPVDAEAFASNIANRLYVNNVTQLYDTAFGTASQYLGEPRMYGLRVRVHFK